MVPVTHIRNEKTRRGRFPVENNTCYQTQEEKRWKKGVASDNGKIFLPTYIPVF